MHRLVPPPAGQVWQAAQSASALHGVPTHSLVAVLQVSPAPVLQSLVCVQ